MDQISLIIVFLKSKQIITPLEKDILDTFEEYQKNPFDMELANRQIISNNTNHPDIFLKVAMLPSTVQKTKEQITETDLRYVLFQQLEFLVSKEIEEINRNK